MDWFFHQPHALTLLQILLDVLLILFLACLFFRRFRRDRNVEELTRSFGKIVEETQRIAAEFETNLQERRQLIQQFLAKLDQQLERAQLMSLKLEALQNQGPLPPPHGSPPSPGLPRTTKSCSWPGRGWTQLPSPGICKSPWEKWSSC